MGPRSILAPAKVNLYLAVGPCRTDGYHDVETVLHTLGFGDLVTVEPSVELALSCDVDLGIACEQNLAWRAAESLARELGREPTLAIRIEKRIPSGAGLGGGSSDAAAVLRAACGIWGVDPLSEPVIKVASGLGADVPFFLVGGCALMSGRGDQLVMHLPVTQAEVVLVNPGVSIPTGSVYDAFDDGPQPERSDVGPLKEALRGGSTYEIARTMRNDLASASIEVEPSVGEALEWLSGFPGVLGASVAGSGATVFALCDEPHATGEIALAARQRGWWSEATSFSG